MCLATECVCLCEVIAGEILYQVLVCVHVHVIFSTIMYVVLAKVCKSTMVCVLALYESQSGLYRDVCGCTCIYSLTVHVCKPQARVTSFPGSTQLSIACSTEKQGEPGIFSHMSMMQSENGEILQN